LLDNAAHQDLKVRTGYSAEFGDSINSVLIFPTEFVFVQREYPILFRKDPSGQLQSVALLGLDKDENLFLENGKWNARYVPAVQQRGPFLIGFRKNETSGEVVQRAGDSHRPSTIRESARRRANRCSCGTVAMRRIWSAPIECCSSSIEGPRRSPPMFAAFEETGILDSMEIEVALDERTKYKLPGFVTISEQRLAKLDGAQLERLNKPGFLHFATFALASLGNFNWLIELKNRKRAAAAAMAGVPADASARQG
jgi:hypothetical protein